ncbi:MAG: hypothetical protein HFH26_10225 [Clostridiaceae bacterium]|nr:hypothetical protein [Clostridiaceae bacterium]
MSNVSTFGAFTMAKLGIYASQKAMQVTGNNISNINTPGYTRQTLDLDSLYIGGADRFTSKWDAKMGSGVLVTGVSQIRSPYLDIRYRTEYSTTGLKEKMLDGLSALTTIFDEVGKGEDGEGIMEAALQNMIDQMERYHNDGAGEATFDEIFQAAAEQVTSIFNSYSKRLENAYNDQKAALQRDVEKVNGILSDIQKLNNAIRKSEIHGSNALELKDERNMLIDELSYYVRINVIYDQEDIGSGVMVEKLMIRLDSGDQNLGTSHDGALLIDGKYATQLKMPDVNVPEENPAPAFVGDFKTTLDALRDVAGRPKMLVEGEQATAVAGPFVKLEPPNDSFQVGDAATELGGKKYTVSGDTLEAQLRDFVKQYNEDAANTGWVAAVNMDKNGIVFKSAQKGISPVQTPLQNDGELKITNPNTGEDYAVMINGTINVNSTLKSQLETFVKAYNADKDHQAAGSTAMLSENGTQIIFIDSKQEPVADTSVPAGSTLFNPGVTPIPDPDNLEVELSDTDLYGGLQAEREMLTEKGEFSTSEDIQADPQASTKRGIPYFQKLWDAMANKFATALNDANTLEDTNGDLKKVGGTGTNKDDYIVKPENYYETKIDETTGEKVFVLADGTTMPMTGADGKYDFNMYKDKDGKDLRVVREQYRGGTLFSNSGDGDDTTKITAGNISISYSWAKNIVGALQSRTDSDVDQSTMNSGLRHLTSILKDNSLGYKLSDIDDNFAAGGQDAGKDITYFTGSFGDFLTKICSRLGTDTSTVLAEYSNSLSSLNEVTVDRDSVSGVDLNDEAIAMMQYNKSYGAACRYLTQLDEMIDKLINGTAL